MKSLSKIKQGDLLISKEGSQTMILARIGDLIARSSWNRFDSFSEWLTLQEAELRDYRVQQNGRFPMTKEEAENLLGIKLID